MFTSKEVTTLVKDERLLDRIVKVGKDEGLDFFDRMNCNAFIKRDGLVARMAVKPQGTKTLEGYVPLCNVSAGFIGSRVR